jgi:hypothetical protein
MNTVRQEAIESLNEALSFVQISNEFYGNGVMSNGIGFSIQMHECSINGAFVRVFETLELFVEKSFIYFLCGGTGINGTAVTRYATPINEEHAYNLLKGTTRFPDFTTRDTIVLLAKNFFDNGGSFICLNAVSQDFEDMKKIRNAISHMSQESQNKFENLVRQKLGHLPSGMTTARFLNLNIPGGNGGTYFSYYRDQVLAIIDLIAMV